MLYYYVEIKEIISCRKLLVLEKDTELSIHLMTLQNNEILLLALNLKLFMNVNKKIYVIGGAI